MGKHHCSRYRNYSCIPVIPCYYPTVPLTQNCFTSYNISVTVTASNFIVNNTNSTPLIFTFINNGSTTVNFTFNNVTIILNTSQSYSTILNGCNYSYTLTGGSLSYTVTAQNNANCTTSGILTSSCPIIDNYNIIVTNNTLLINSTNPCLKLTFTSQEINNSTLLLNQKCYELVPQVPYTIDISSNTTYTYQWYGTNNLPFSLNCSTSGGNLIPTIKTTISSTVTRNVLTISGYPNQPINLKIVLLSSESSNTTFTFNNVNYILTPLLPQIICITNLSNTFNWAGVNPLAYTITASNAILPIIGSFSPLSYTITNNSLVIPVNLQNVSLTVVSNENNKATFTFNNSTYIINPRPTLSMPYANLSAGSYPYTWNGVNSLPYTLTANGTIVSTGSFPHNKSYNNAITIT